MILVKGYGQMCNNILQYAHIYAFAREHGVRTFSLRFSYKYRHFPICKKWYHNPLFYVLSKLLIQLRLIPLVGDPESAEVDRRLRETPLIAYGGWHSRYPELFQKYRQEILELFAIDPKAEEKVKGWMKRLPEADLTLGLHIRRGDYARWQGGKYFFDDSVYQQKIREFVALHPGKRVNVLICTNDPQLDLANYRTVHPQVFLSEGSAIEDLSLLAHCDYLLGVKSTFSLWASVYRDLPLYWIEDRETPLSLAGFKTFLDLCLLV